MASKEFGYCFRLLVSVDTTAKWSDNLVPPQIYFSHKGLIFLALVLNALVVKQEGEMWNFSSSPILIKQNQLRWLTANIYPFGFHCWIFMMGFDSLESAELMAIVAFSSKFIIWFIQWQTLHQVDWGLWFIDRSALCEANTGSFSQMSRFERKLNKYLITKCFSGPQRWPQRLSF